MGVCRHTISNFGRIIRCITWTLPATNVFYNLEVSARRRPDKPCLVYYDTRITFAEVVAEAERLAGYLEQRCGVRKGDRVLLSCRTARNS